VASGEWRVASGEWRVASGEWRVASGGLLESLVVLSTFWIIIKPSIFYET
jgi:hypothetical protein